MHARLAERTTVVQTAADLDQVARQRQPTPRPAPPRAALISSTSSPFDDLDDLEPPSMEALSGVVAAMRLGGEVRSPPLCSHLEYTLIGWHSISHT
jgi:hypothetical protein